MSFFEKLSRGWDISLNSFKVLRENRQLIIFPIFSGLAMVLLTLSFVVALFGASNWDAAQVEQYSRPLVYSVMFAFYVLNYFIVVFFNTALIYCSSLYFKGEKPTVRAGLAFSRSRIGNIFAWSLFAATVGFILRIVQENLGWVGKIITGMIGLVWNIATFFAVPVLIFEQTGPIETVKRSAQLMKEKWGESIGAGFSFGIIRLLSIFLVCGTAFCLGALIHPVAGIVLAGLGLLVIIAVLNASETIFVSAMYHNIHGDPVKHFDDQFADRLFVSRK